MRHQANPLTVVVLALIQPKRCIDWGDQVPDRKHCNTLNVHFFTYNVLVLIISMFSMLVPYPHGCHFRLSAQTSNELPSHSACYADNPQGPPYKLPYKGMTSNFHWDIPYSSVPLLTVYNQILLLVHLPLMGFFNSVLPRHCEF